MNSEFAAHELQPSLAEHHEHHSEHSQIFTILVLVVRERGERLAAIMTSRVANPSVTAS